MLREAFATAQKEALRSGDKMRLAAVRLITAALKDQDIAARGDGREPLSDADILALLQKMVKQRREAADIYAKAGRQELADQELGEISVLESFMPAQMDSAAIGAAVREAIAETGAASMKDMGKVVAALKAKYTGQMNFAEASAAVKAALSA
ncbi:aspartyl-tRNA amidotransferase subunit B [Camelimonas fluminis]|uniref:GatB/YqeY domain-containing protein n=1 Tax=Camelimonas fluminis TaxID=1576911 RepID=A0ABV7UFZ0_9HYPH|nr:GatB/YqeY domain-containing protein [Camelimonas fluminis]GHE71075.1 aspartyl-tRNA amidotransferase subunit B [Camelimonas fluminis]